MRQSDLEEMTDKEVVDEIDSRNVWIAQSKEHITDPDKPWEVIKENGDRAIKNFHTRAEAWERAKELAKKNATQNQRAGARVKNMSNGQFSENNFYPSPSADPYYGGEQASNDPYEDSREVINISIFNGKPVKASEYYDPRFESGLGDGYKPARRLSKDLYIDGREKNGKIAHNRDVKAAQATNSTVTFMYAPNKNLSEDKLEALSNILGVRMDHIYFYRDVPDRDKPYINAMYTTPESQVDADTIGIMLDKKNIQYDTIPGSGSVTAYIPVEMMED